MSKVLESHIKVGETNIREFYFSHRVAERWNSLDQEMVDSPSVNAFKGRLDKVRQTTVHGFFMD